jgi:hypothetical protein
VRSFAYEYASVAPTAVTGQSILASSTGAWSFDGRWTSSPAAPARPLTRPPLTGETLALGDSAWVWSGSNWNPVGSWGFDLVQSASAVAVDAAEGQLIFAGSSTGVLDFVNSRPAHLFAVPLTQACASSELFRSVVIRARGGGRGTDSDGGVAPGAELVVRRLGRLERVGLCEGDPASSSSCSATLDEVGALSRWLTRERGFQPDVEVGLASRFPSGRLGSVVQTEGLEFRLRYRRRDAGTP